MTFQTLANKIQTIGQNSQKNASQLKCLECEKVNHDKDGRKIHLRETHEKDKVSKHRICDYGDKN